MKRSISYTVVGMIVGLITGWIINGWLSFCVDQCSSAQAFLSYSVITSPITISVSKMLIFLSVIIFGFLGYFLGKRQITPTDQTLEKVAPKKLGVSKFLLFLAIAVIVFISIALYIIKT